MKQFIMYPLVAALMLTACDKNTPKEDPTTDISANYHIAMANGTGSNSATVVQGLSTLAEGSIDVTKGFSLNSSRTARIFASTDRKYIWSLNYTQGIIEKLEYKGSDKYERIVEIDTSKPLGQKTVRFTKLNDKVGSVHYVTSKPVGTGTEYEGHKMSFALALLDLDKMELIKGFQPKVEFMFPTEMAKAGYFISRIDCPMLSGNKLYYGCAVSKFDAKSGKNKASDIAMTLIVDYNDLTKISYTINDKLRGATNGYRTPTQHFLEDGSILQLVSGVQANGKQEVHLAKLVKGAYETSFDINLSTLLGKEARSDGFFYAGDGIAYIPYEDYTTENKVLGVDPGGKETKSYEWKIARVDIKAGTAIDLEVPRGLWLRQFQNAVVRRGMIFFPLSPIGKPGHIYIFDVASTSPKGNLGATIDGTGVDQYFIGIY